MPRPIPRLLALLLAAAPPCAAAEDGAPAVDAAWIVQAVARPAPSRTAFVELRSSPMLRQPLRLEGEYRREADGRLVRQVHAPYAETTTLEDGQATVERAGRAPRRIALARAPELAAVRNGFGALLAGDAERLQQHYTLHAEGGRQRWTLALVPRDPRLAASLARIVLHGRGAELRCVESRPVKGEPQRTLLAGAAAEAAGVTDASALAALCRGDAAR